MTFVLFPALQLKKRLKSPVSYRRLPFEVFAADDTVSVDDIVSNLSVVEELKVKFLTMSVLFLVWLKKKKMRILEGSLFTPNINEIGVMILLNLINTFSLRAPIMSQEALN